MTPGARLSAAIEILDGVLADRGSAERLIAEWGRGARYAGSKDRAAVADLLYAALRRLASARLGAEPADGRAALLGALRLEGAALEEIDALADGGPHRPEPLSDAERARLARLPQAVDEIEAAQGALDFPDWLRPELARSVADPDAEIAALRRRAAFDFRVNTLKSDIASAAGALAADGLATAPGPISPLALRASGVGAAARPKLSGLSAYIDGLVEPQDAASQALALIAAEAVSEASGVEAPLAIDLCAGGGGKTLALCAALTGGAGGRRARVAAFDVAPARMRELPERLARAGAAAEILDRRGLDALRGRSDMVLVDAPCSGSGSWARRPEAKWRLTPERLAALQAMQAEALALAAPLLRPGGALIYATCSLLDGENAGAGERFLVARPDFAPAPIAPLWEKAGLAGAPRPPFGRDGALAEAAAVFTPAAHGTDGFFILHLARESGLR